MDTVNATGKESWADKKCLIDANFEEIKNLVKYITGDLVPFFDRLEAKVEELTEKLHVLETRNKATKRKRQPLFNLNIDDESDEEEEYV